MKLNGSRQRQKGSVLLLVLFLLIVLAMMGSAFSILLPVEMQNARRDRANLQTAYAADAAVLWVMSQLESGKDGDIDYYRSADAWDELEGTEETLDKEWRYRIVSIDRLNGEEAYKVVTEGIRIRGTQQDVLRRATAIIDNGLQSEEPAILISSAGANDTGGMSGGQTSWPGNVPINGDVLVAGRWSVDDSLFDPANGQMFTGQVTQTLGGGNGLRGENYNNNPLDASDYPTYYQLGLDAVQTVSPTELNEAIYLASNPARQRLQQYLFQTSDTSKIDTMNTTTSNSNGLHIPVDSSGTSNGSIVINDGGGNGDNYKMVFSADAAGNSITTVTGDALNKVNTITSDDPLTLTEVSNVSTGGTFKIIHATAGGTFGSGAGSVTVPPGEGRLIVVNSANQVLYDVPAELSSGHAVVYSHGSIEAEGTIAGKKTVAATLGVTITGEILKDKLPRNMSTEQALALPDDQLSQDDKDRIKNSLVGLIANVEAGNASKGFRFDIQSFSPDNKYNIHASLMGLVKTDVNAKIFGHNLHGSIPNGAKFHLYGQLASGPSNTGQFKKEIEFIADNFDGFTMDDLLAPWPSRGAGFRSNLRAYVDGQQFETE